ncbi:MAG: hypothetical protein WKF80_10655, partial [Thermomicrobiales bacterium]
MRAGESWAYRERPNKVGTAVQRAEIIKTGTEAGNKALVRVEVNGRMRAEQWVPRSRLIALWEQAEGLVEAEEQVSAALEATETPDGLSREAVGVTLATAPITLGMRIGTGERER